VLKKSYPDLIGAALKVPENVGYRGLIVTISALSK
jgi:hypothetical protein